MNNDQEIILAKISAVYDKPPFVKMETGQMEMILKCVGLGAYYDKYREYLEPYWYNGRFQNPVESYRIFVGLNSIFEDLLNERKGDEIISLLTELGNYIPGTILSDEARFAADFNKLRQLYNLMGLQIVSMEVDEYSSKFQVEPYLNEGNQIIQSFGMERWLKSKYQDVYEAYESALNSFSSGDLGAAIESCRTALTGIFSKYKGVPFQKAKWMLGMATLTGDFTGTQSADASEMTSIKNEIEAMGKRDIADFFEENLEGSYKKTKAIYSIYSMLSDYGTHRLEGTVEVAKNEDGDTMPDLPANAIPVFYGDDYMDLPFFLSEIAVTRLQRMAGLRSIVSVNPYLKRRTVTSAFGRMHFSNGFNPFVGRVSELNALNAFLQSNEKFLWQTVLGEGGIGKSRLILEWMKTMPSNWFGFFALKRPEAAYQFTPFTDTVVAFDYVLGQEQQCADMIAAFIEVFSVSPYKLRIVLLERHQKLSEDDWLTVLKRKMPSEARLEFETGTYPNSVLTIGMLSEKDELSYIENYLDAYLPLLNTSPFVEKCRADKANTAKTIQAAFRDSMKLPCLRPLFLSVFIEVWLSKEGHTKLTSAEELLSEYLNKEKKRWKQILGDDALVDSYLRVLSVACIVKTFNITDVRGTNYLEEDCEKLISFFDARSERPGADNLFEDLFVSVSEQEDEQDRTMLFDLLYNEVNKKSKKIANGDSLESLEQDEKFSLLAPYIKVDANPQEVYLDMLVRADAATEEEKQKLVQLQKQRIQKEKTLPDHAWFLEPCFPDIINEYIVAYAVNERNAERFAKLVRSNSVLDLANFISLALDDWPENSIFQKIAVTPPEEELNTSEYYLGLMLRIAEIKDITAVEDVLLERDPIFQRYELELWRRIAIVLTDRGDTNRLFDSSVKYACFIKELSGQMMVRDEAADAMEAYCVGLHNAEAVDEYHRYLSRSQS